MPFEPVLHAACDHEAPRKIAMAPLSSIDRAKSRPTPQPPPPQNRGYAHRSALVAELRPVQMTATAANATITTATAPLRPFHMPNHAPGGHRRHGRVNLPVKHGPEISHNVKLSATKFSIVW